MSNSYHFIGIGGIGMSGIARLLLSQGMAVSGSDIASNGMTNTLAHAGAVIYEGHAEKNLPLESTVIYSSDIKSDNPEYQAALKNGSKLIHRSDMLAELLAAKKALAVTGTHGKTTVSSLLSTVLVEANLDPCFAVGGIIKSSGCNSRWGKGDFFSFEADESDRSFLKYHPYGAIITNIDNDHLVNFENNFDCLLEHFRTFIYQVKSPAHVFWCCDDSHLSKMEINGQSFGFNSKSDWKISRAVQHGFRMIFDIENRGNLYKNIELSLTGMHNVLNATAVFGLCIHLGIPEKNIRRTLESFQGVSRRCENKGNWKGIDFIDDYAHHPTEIRATLEAIKHATKERRLVAVFQPHRYSRIIDCLGFYGTIFNQADQIIITDIYAAGESPLPHISHAVIQKEIEENSPVPHCYIPRPDLSCFLRKFLQKGDVLVTLGAGDITRLTNEIICHE